MQANKPPLITKEMQPALPLLYLAATLLVTHIALVLDMALMWLMSRYFIHHYGSMQFPQKAYIYDSVKLSFLAATFGLGHYYVALAGRLALRGKFNIMSAWLLSAFVIGALAYHVAAHTVFKPALLATLPVLLAFAVGGRAGWSETYERNPFKKYL